MLSYVFTGAGPRDPVLRRQVAHFTRCVDMALNQYSDAHACYTHMRGPDGAVNLAAVLRGSEHLEMCLVCLKRAFAAMDRLKSERESLISRAARRPLENYAKEFSDVRGAVVHMDEWIAGGDPAKTLAPGQTSMVEVTEDGDAIEVAKYQIPMARLAAAIRRLNDLARSLVKYRPS